MTDGRAAVGLDRLPWLSDEPARRAPARVSAPGVFGVLGWAIAALLLVAGVSYWLGMRTGDSGEPVGRQAQQPSNSRATTTAPLPPPRSDALPPKLEQPAPPPAIEPMAAAPIPIEAIPEPEPRATVEKRKPAAPAAKPRKAVSPATQPSTEETESAPERIDDPLRPWPVRVIDGASGRLVRIGTFTSPRQAKKGWWAIMRINPALKRLPALVVPVQSLRDGKVYYRLQMGTTSQAHSAVLCQRMRMIGQSCVVIGVEDRGSELAM